MKKTRKRICGILMAALMVCLPAVQALAQTYDASVTDPMPVLFPGDVLTGIATPLTLDGEPVALGEEVPAVWTNDSKGKVYSASTGEDGSVLLTLAGYELDVTGGTSTEADETAEPVGGHYVPAADEVVDESVPETDRAYYPAYTVVKIKADEPEEGMEFDKWTVEQEDVFLEDELNSETTVTMPEKKVSVTANYRPVQTEAAEEPVEQPADVVTDQPVDDPAVGGEVDSYVEDPAGQPADAVTDQPVDDPAAGEEVDPYVEDPAGQPADVVADQPADDPAAGGEVDPYVEDPAGQPADVVIDQPADDPAAGGEVDPYVEDPAGQPADVVIDQPVDDPAAGGEVDPYVEDPAGQPADSVEGSGENEIDTMMDGLDDSAFPITTSDEYNSGDTDTAAYSLDVYFGEASGENVAYGESTGEVSMNYSIPAGTSVTVTANDYSANGYYFSYWDIKTGNVILTPADNASVISFEMPEGNVELAAQYANSDGTPVADPQVAPPQTNMLNAVYSGTAMVDGVEISFPAEIENGKTVTVVAADNTSEGYQFAGWAASSMDETGADVPMDLALTGDVNNPLAASFEMPASDLSLTATYEPILYTAAVADAEGTVTAADGTKAESALFTAGTMVTVEAFDKTAEGYDFIGWTVSSDDGSMNAETVGLSRDGENPFMATFAMPAVNVLLTANYELIPAAPEPIVEPEPTAEPTAAPEPTAEPTIEPTAAPEPTAEPTTAPEPTVEPTAAPEPTVEPTAAPEPTAEPTTAPEPTAEPTATPEPTVEPTVEPTATPEPTIEPTATPEQTDEPADETEKTRSTVTVVNGVIAKTGTDSGSYPAGKSIKLQASAPEAGMQFVGWSAKAETGENVADSFFTAVDEMTTRFTVPASDVTVTAEYRQIKYKITVNDGTADHEKAAESTVVTIIANEAPDGMEFDYWKVDSGNVSLRDAYSATTTFTMPFADVELSAYYRMKEYHVTVQNGHADNGTYYMGQQVTIYSDYPASGKEFDQWQAVSGNVSFGDASRWKTTFTMPASDVTVNAAYKNGPSPESNQVLDLVAGGEYITDSTIKFTAAGAGMDNSNPNPGDYRYRPTGYQIGNVTGSWQASPYTTSMSIKARGDYTLKVNYSKDVYDGTNWVADGTTDTRSVTFRVLTPAEAVATGDETPVAMMLVLAGASCLLFLLLLSVFVRRRKGI